MEKFTYYHPITVRYADLDPQNHVNNAVYLTYVESARLGYYQQTGIWDPESDRLTGMVVARNEIDYLASVNLGQAIRVGIRLVRIGNSSLTLAFQLERPSDGAVIARGQSVMVAYDNDAHSSRPFPPEWREMIHQYEEGKG